MSHYQYSPQVGPLNTTAPSETITIDKWANELPPPVRRVPMRALCLMAMAMPVFVPLPQDAPQPIDRWLSRFPDKVDRRVLPRAAHLYQAQNVLPLPPVVASASGGSVIPTGSYTLWQYQALAGPIVESTIPPVLALNWQPVYPDAIRQKVGIRAALTPAWVMDKFTAPTAPTVPTFFGGPVQADLIRPRQPFAHQQQAFAMDTQWTAPPQNPATTLWMPKGADRPQTRPYPRAVYTWAQQHFVVQISVPVMSWTGLYLDPPMKAISHRALIGTKISAPLVIADVTTIAPVLSWKGYQPEQARSAIHSVAAKTSTGIGPLFIADVIDPSPVMSWQGRYPDKTYGKTSIPTGAQKSWTMDATFTAPTPPIVPALAKAVYPDRVPGKPQPTVHPDMRAPEYVLDVTVPAPQLSWAPIYPSSATIAMRQPELLPAEVFVIRPPRHFKIQWAKGTTKIYGPTRPTNPEED